MPNVRHMRTTAEDIKSRWGTALQRKREATGETQVQFAARLGRDPQTVSRLERGQGSLESYVAAAQLLDVELVGEVGE